MIRLAELDRCTESVDVDVIRESGAGRDIEQIPGRSDRVHTVVNVESLVTLQKVGARQHDGCRFIDRFDPVRATTCADTPKLALRMLAKAGVVARITTIEQVATGCRFLTMGSLP